MKITKRQLRRIIQEERSRILSESGAPYLQANKLLDETMTFLENKLYGKYPDEEVDNFAVDAMNVMAGIEQMLVNLMNGSYRENY